MTMRLWVYPTEKVLTMPTSSSSSSSSIIIIIIIIIIIKSERHDNVIV